MFDTLEKKPLYCDKHGNVLKEEIIKKKNVI